MDEFPKNMLLAILKAQEDQKTVFRGLALAEYREFAEGRGQELFQLTYTAAWAVNEELEAPEDWTGDDETEVYRGALLIGAALLAAKLFGFPLAQREPAQA